MAGLTALAAPLILTSLIHARQASPPAAAAPADQAKAQAAPSGSTMTPVQRADAAAKGTLKNPYNDSDKAVVDSGSKLYFKYGCNGCHGGSGGGGMCPPLTNDTWVYGGDDDTLFRLVSLPHPGPAGERLYAQGHGERRRPNAPHGAGGADG